MTHWFEEIAKAVAAEREACAQIADEHAIYPILARDISGFKMAKDIAALIRARGEQKTAPAERAGE